MARLRRFKRPESEDEEMHVVYGSVHQCNLEVPEVDRAVLFPIGVYGYGFPNGVTFEVATVEPCEGCGNILRMWAVWDGATIIDLGARRG